MDERALVKKLNKGSRSALDQAIEHYTPYVGAVVLRALAGRACREDVEELCADVFVALCVMTQSPIQFNFSSETGRKGVQIS